MHTLVYGGEDQKKWTEVHKPQLLYDAFANASKTGALKVVMTP